MNDLRGGLEARFPQSLAERDVLPAAGSVVVAVSGGLDSCVLLHLLRFHSGRDDLRWVVAHFDHGMRDSSVDDACWVRGLARAWGLECRLGRTEAPLRSEDAARRARYAFLERVRRETGSARVLTAHHADDQAETVLFRILRGTGQRGLAGVPELRDGVVSRPLLRVWRRELEEYAARVGLRWREDETNRELRFARNVLRNRILPEAERSVAPGARRALVRLAERAREDEAGWQSVIPGLIEPLDVSAGDDGVDFDRAGLLDLHPAVRARVLRNLASRVGLELDEAVTRIAVEFAGAAESGTSVDLGSSVALRRELDRLVIGLERPAPADRHVTIPDVGPGRGRALLGGLTLDVAWGGPAAGRRRAIAQSFEPEGLSFPLLVRSREPGDRIRLSGGTKKVNKLLLERRVPRTARARVPLLVDAEGDVLWIPGLALARGVTPARHALTICVGS